MEQKQEWVERFDKEFRMSGQFTDHLKAFIEKQLHSAREEAYKRGQQKGDASGDFRGYMEGLKNGKTVERARVRKVIAGMKNMYPTEIRVALNDLLSTLEGK